MKKQNATTLGHWLEFSAPAVLNTLPEGAYITDVDRKIVFWNQAAERITGWTSTDVVGSTCFDNILVHVDKDGHPLCGKEHCPLHRSIVTGQSATVPIMVFAQKKNGERVPVEVTVAPIRDTDGKIVGGIEVFRDLTDSVHEMIRARMIQDQVLHSPLVKDARVAFDVRYVPNEIVGGDFYRIEKIDADRYAVMVADVMGHGVSAALYTMQLRSLWEDHRAELASPAAFLTVLNKQLHSLTRDSGYFATGVCLTLNAATGEFRYVRAGHPSPLIVRSNGRVRALDSRHPSLGMFYPLKYREATGRMDKGDTLLLYTDGAIEVANADGGELGEDGLKKILTEVGVDLERLEERLLKYSNQIHLADDLTLLKVCRR
jgi:PAS domain S-box-containing protein